MVLEPGQDGVKAVPPVVAGIDLGSLCTKAVLIDSEGKVVSYSIIRSGAIYQGAAEKSFGEALTNAGLKASDVQYIVATGYGRNRVPFANEQITEISCHARGAKWTFPEIHTIVDIGGQDSKVIYVGDQGQVMNFVMNDKCAAGTGRFLEVMAVALEVYLDQLGTLSLQSTKDVEVSSMCTVFAESEVISLIASGTEKADIAASIHRAIARRVSGMVGQLGLREKVSMSGGVAKNIGVVRALEKKLRTTLLLAPEPQIIGALGAALVAADRSGILAVKA
ncbi:MAG: acyl-CoA dehydratase activase [Chloroflexota bacterium]|nr:acyl-CoA dehydratase activase [Chloroflexota bacterium]